MKKNLPSLLAVACIAVASQMISCSSYNPVRTDEPGPGTHGLYDSSRYRLNEVIVMFKSEPTTESRNKIKGQIQASGIDSATIEMRRCNSCNGYVELWKADSLHTRIHAQGIAGGTRPGGSKPVGEDSLAHYSLNFKQDIPMDFLKEKKLNFNNVKKVENEKGKKDIVRIAVLDTGIDTARIIGSSYLWTNPGADADSNCYKSDKFGWNFTGNIYNNDVHDDNPNLHGTLVSNYIINQFATSTKSVELMILKTHDKDGFGDLFSSICAIYYAMERGAQIINASWGFYYYQDRPHPYLDYLITTVLREKGILFVAAAGNKVQDRDDFARKVYQATHPGVTLPDSYFRDLECHSFYPACLSTENNNVVTVTTADRDKVSPTQNFSSKYVDIGAIPDDLSMRFKVPFDPSTYISGSSFATAIVTGRIGANLPNGANATNATILDKQEILGPMQAASLIEKSPALESDHIRMGRITLHN
jgi:hypothetical protein